MICTYFPLLCPYVRSPQIWVISVGERNILLITLHHFLDLRILGEDLGLSLNCSSRGRGPRVSKCRYYISILSVRWSILSSEWIIFPLVDDGDLRVLLGVDL